MVKIKQKKTMNLTQLIEHIWANNLRHKWKDSDNTSAYVQVYDDGQLVVDKCTKDSVFTVEVEEEITEDTEFKTLIEVTEIQNVFTHIKASINEINHDTVVEIHALINGRLTLIWRDGKLVE